MMVEHHIHVPESRRGKEPRGSSPPFKRITQTLHTIIVFTIYWPKIDHMNTASCKAIWKMKYSVQPYIRLKIILLWKKGRENRSGTNQSFLPLPVHLISNSNGVLYVWSITLLSTNYAPHPAWVGGTSGAGF